MVSGALVDGVSHARDAPGPVSLDWAASFAPVPPEGSGMVSSLSKAAGLVPCGRVASASPAWAVSGAPAVVVSGTPGRAASGAPAVVVSGAALSAGLEARGGAAGTGGPTSTIALEAL